MISDEKSNAELRPITIKLKEVYTAPSKSKTYFTLNGAIAAEAHIMLDNHFPGNDFSSETKGRLFNLYKAQIAALTEQTK